MPTFVQSSARRRAGAMVAALGLALSAMFAVSVTQAPAASAAVCGGSLINTKALRTDAGTVVGYLDVYYSGSTGRNCAVTRHSGPSYGVSRNTWVAIVRCDQATAGNGCTYPESRWVRDEDYYAYYAGPVSIAAAGYCIRVTGGLIWNGDPVVDSITGHCG
ncbi:hypothetical protein [Myceligenerans crystallogenes]|uniref:Spore-associated protein A n=1 Tax=Myceligenerans crystallogenes TaxID=316335 RepID=A0ABN2N973_9MICO